MTLASFFGRRIVSTMLISAALIVGATPLEAQTTSRLKDIATVQGPQSLPLIGYGLVVGLNKTGDRRQTMFSAQSLANMLERFGVAVPGEQIKIENIAAVLVTAELGPYQQNGSRLDITASSIGDARSLQGGTLLPTPLRGPDGVVLALGQGPLSIGGFGAGSAGSSVTVNHLTVGRVPRGAIVQVTRERALGKTTTLKLMLNEPDFMSAEHLASAVNNELQHDAATVEDAGTIAIEVPATYQASVASLIARLEPLEVALDSAARVVINERTGTIVLGGDVRLRSAAVAHGNLSVRISTDYNVSQPLPYSMGQTTVTPQTGITVQEGTHPMVALGDGTTLADVVKALNALGATPRDIIAILQALKAAGALHAELVIL